MRTALKHPLLRSGLALGLVAGLAACGEERPVVPEPVAPGPTLGADGAPPDAPMTGTAKARIGPASGSEVRGEAVFTQSDLSEVRLELTLRNLPAGRHAVHIHETGDCSAPDASSAGGHWNPGEKPHGRWGEPPHHLGDIGNVRADAQGMARLNMTTDRWALDDGADGVDGNDGLNGVSGKAVVVHAGTDDYESQPSGAAGARIGCGVIERTR